MMMSSNFPAMFTGQGKKGSSRSLKARPLYVSELRPADVLFGRGSGPNDHEGNIQFREMVAERKEEYMATNHRQTKVKIARSIVDAVLAKNGRFLKKVSASEAQSKAGYPPGVDAFEIVDDDTIMEKAKQALRQNRDKPSPVSAPTSGALASSTRSNATADTAVVANTSGGTRPSAPGPTLDGTPKRRSATVVPSTSAGPDFLDDELSSSNAEAAAIASSVAAAAATVKATENYAERQRHAYNAISTGNYTSLPQHLTTDDIDDIQPSPMQSEFEPEPLPPAFYTTSYAQAKQIYQLRQFQQLQQQQQQQQQLLQRNSRPQLQHTTTIGSNAATINAANVKARESAGTGDDDDDDDEYDDFDEYDEENVAIEGGPQFITYTTPLVDGAEDKFYQRDSISTMGSRRDSYGLGYGTTRRGSIFGGRRDSMSVGSRRDSMSIASRRESTDSRRSSLHITDIWTTPGQRNYEGGYMGDLMESFKGMSTSIIDGHSSADTIGTIDTMYTSGNGLSGMSVMSLSSNASFFKIGSTGSPTTTSTPDENGGSSNVGSTSSALGSGIGSGSDEETKQATLETQSIPTSSARMYGMGHGRRVLPLGDQFASASSIDDPLIMQRMPEPVRPSLMDHSAGPSIASSLGTRESMNFSDIWRTSSTGASLLPSSINTFNLSDVGEPRSIEDMRTNPDTLADLGRSSMSIMRAACEGSSFRASSGGGRRGSAFYSGGSSSIGGGNMGNLAAAAAMAATVFDINGTASILDRQQQQQQQQHPS